MPRYAVDFVADVQEITTCEDFTETLDLQLNSSCTPVVSDNNVPQSLMGNIQDCIKENEDKTYDKNLRHIVISRGIQCGKSRLSRKVKDVKYHDKCIYFNKSFDQVSESSSSSMESTTCKDVKLNSETYSKGKDFPPKRSKNEDIHVTFQQPTESAPPALRNSTQFKRKNYADEDNDDDGKPNDDVDIESLSATISLSNFSFHDKIYANDSFKPIRTLRKQKLINAAGDRNFSNNVFYENEKYGVNQEELLKPDEKNACSTISRDTNGNSSSTNSSSTEHLKKKKELHAVFQSVGNSDSSELLAEGQPAEFQPSQISKSNKSQITKPCIKAPQENSMTNFSVRFSKGSEESLEIKPPNKMVSKPNLRASSLNRKSSNHFYQTSNNRQLSPFELKQRARSNTPPDKLPNDEFLKAERDFLRTKQKVDKIILSHKKIADRHQLNDAAFDEAIPYKDNKFSNDHVVELCFDNEVGKGISKPPVCTNSNNITPHISFSSNSTGKAKFSPSRNVFRSRPITPIYTNNNFGGIPKRSDSNISITRGTQTRTFKRSQSLSPNPDRGRGKPEFTKVTDPIKPIRQKFYLAESAHVEMMLSDPSDRRIKAICDRHKCDIEVFSKIIKNGFLKNIVVLTAPSQDHMRRCVRALDLSLGWCLTSQMK